MSKIADKTKSLAMIRSPETERGRLYVVQPITGANELQRYGLTDLALLQAAPRKRRLPSNLFLFVVLLPIVAGAAYNFLIASDRFVSTASFVVRETNRGGLLSLVGTGGMTRSDDDSFAIGEYITSRDAVDWLARREALAEMFADSNVDYFSRFPTALAGDTREDLYRHFQHYVDVDFNTSTGISTLSVQGFSPETANRLTAALLDAAEALMNDLNGRARRDALEFASNLVENAEARLTAAQAEMTAFRNEQSVLNPDGEVDISNVLMTDTLRNLSETDAQIAQQTAATPDNPNLPQLKFRREALIKNIEAQRSAMAGSNGSLALKMEGYDRIRLERDIAEKSLVNAANALDLAEQESQRGHLYLERVVSPSTPDRYGYPRRYWNMLLLTGICLGLFWLIRKTTAILTESGR